MNLRSGVPDVTKHIILTFIRYNLNKSNRSMVRPLWGWTQRPESLSPVLKFWTLFLWRKVGRAQPAPLMDFKRSRREVTILGIRCWGKGKELLNQRRRNQNVVTAEPSSISFISLSLFLCCTITISSSYKTVLLEYMMFAVHWIWCESPTHF